MVLPVNSSGNKDYNNFEIYEKAGVWLFILLLMIEFFYIKPIGTLILIGRGIVFLAMELLWLLIGVTYYKSRHSQSIAEGS